MAVGLYEIQNRYVFYFALWSCFVLLLVHPRVKFEDYSRVAIEERASAYRATNKSALVVFLSL
jgi:hypothetical protein